MGNSESEHQLSLGIKQFIQQQFAKLREDSTRQHLTITEIIQANHPEDFPFTFRHFAILYVADFDLDGVFSLKDIHMFALWVQINMNSIQMYEFQAQLQAKAVAKMIEDIQKNKGQDFLVNWSIKALLESHRRTKIDGVYFIIIDGIKTIYQVFNVQMMTDMDIQSFFYLVKRSSEEMGFKIEEIIEHEQEEQYISIKVCQQFVKAFIKGILKLLKDIGYNSDLI